MSYTSPGQTTTKTSQLLDIQQNSKDDYSVSVEDIRKLKSMIPETTDQGKVIVIGVAGRSRIGKSFLLNLLMHYSDHHQDRLLKDLPNPCKKLWRNSRNPVSGIKWCSGDEGTTKGIYISQKPIEVITSDGQKVYILLVDTQGLDDQMDSVDGNIDRLLLISSLRICDLLIYNVHGSTSCYDLRALASIVRSWDDIKSEEALFKNLLFLHRDWQANREFGHQPDMLKSKAEKARNPSLYRSIDKAFRNATSFTVPHPGETIAHASEDENLVLSAQTKDERFLKYMEKLFKMILGLGKDDSYFKQLVNNGESGALVIERFKKFKEWAEDPKSFSYDEVLRLYLEENKDKIYKQWEEEANNNCAKRFNDESITCIIPPAEKFLDMFKRLIIYVNTLPICSEYYESLKDKLSCSVQECKQMITEFEQCKNPKELAQFFEKWYWEDVNAPSSVLSKGRIIGTLASGVFGTGLTGQFISKEALLTFLATSAGTFMAQTAWNVARALLAKPEYRKKNQK